MLAIAGKAVASETPFLRQAANFTLSNTCAICDSHYFTFIPEVLIEPLRQSAGAEPVPSWTRTRSSIAHKSPTGIAPVARVDTVDSRMLKAGTGAAAGCA